MRHLTLSLSVLLILFGAFIFWRAKYTQQNLSFEGELSVVENVQERQSVPILLKTPSLGFNLKVEETGIMNGEWQVPVSNLGHLAVSARPGEGDNIVIYGHNKKSIFGKLGQMKAGDIVVVESEEGKEWEYQVIEKIVVNPDRMDLVGKTDEEILTLYTCTGWLDSKRLIVRARLKTSV